VPRQRPDAVLAAIEAHVGATCPPGVVARVLPEPGAVRAYAIDADHPAVAAALRALRTAYPDQTPIPVRIGGTLPAAVLFEEHLGLKTLLYSFSTADENLHAPNEFFRIRRLEEGIAAWSELWRLLPEALAGPGPRHSPRE
jgi:acetylornithine deacetylase/succinyl-diaminopimelate desuccinylase-like protein